MRSVSVLALILLGASMAFGQTNKGTISGTVFDANGAAVPGATVTITNLGTNQATTLTTSSSGAFTLASLDPVSYSVDVEATGFKRARVETVKVDTASTASVNILLETGSVQEQITVVADTPLLNTEGGATTATITERQLQDVPLNNRSVLDLAVTAPNVSGDAGSEDAEVTSGQPVPGFNLSLNGGRPGSTAILADGVNNTGVGIARAVVSFTPETVQEFTVQTSAYSAEYGNTGGGVINATTKSGTNDFHGVALWYHRNPKTAASPYRIGTGPRPPGNLRYNQVSISAGGPVYLPRFGEGGPALYDGHDRTFFFFAYEPRWRRDFLTVTTILPTAAQRAGDFRNLVRTSSGFLPIEVANRFPVPGASIGPADIYRQFNLVNGRLVPIVLGAGQTFPQFSNQGQLNVIPPEFLDPNARSLLEFLPMGGDYFIDDAGLIRNHTIQRFVQQDETRYTLRLDHNINNNQKVNFRYTVTPAVGVRGFASDVNGNSAAYSDAKQLLLAFNSIISPTIVNDLRLNYTRGVFSEDFSPQFSINGGRNLATELGLPSLTSGGLPLFQFNADQGGNAFSDIGSSGSTNNFNVEERFNINDILYWTRGNMTWKAGVDLNHARLNVVPFFAASGGRWQFRSIQTNIDRGTASLNTRGGNSFASFLIGVPNVVDIRPLLIDYNYRWNSGALFVQNDWKVRPNLTLNLGLRYSLQYPRYEKNNLQGVFRPDLATTVTLTDAQRRQMATGFGIPTTAPIPNYLPTTATIPPFAFSGMGGRSKYITSVDYWGFEPRFGFAYSPKLNIFGMNLESKSVVIRGGFGLSHAPLTGNNRSPNPDFGQFITISNLATGSPAGNSQDPNQPIRLSGNTPVVAGRPLFEQLNVTSDGLVLQNSIAIPGVADLGVLSDSGKVPYSQNWNLSMSFEPFRNTVLEFAYVGNKGTHLYMPLVNLNPRNIDFVEFLEGQNLNAETTFNDPLGRRNLAGGLVTIQRSSVQTAFFGFNNLNRFFDPSANSIRHAAYVDMRRRVSRGFTFTANYTFGKSIDDASDASPDTRVITEVGQTQGHVSYGAPRALDRSISTFDIKHNFSSTFVLDLPVGRGRQLLREAPGVLDAIVGGWTTSGVFRLQGGTPFLPYLTDTNRLGGTNRTVRPNIIQGVPLVNPLWSEDCMLGATCEPYVNPAAFIRPPKGELGNAPRTLDSLRAPIQEYFDLSFQKNFRWPFADNEGKRRINFRVDLINAFNHPVFRLGSSGSAGFTTAVPSEALVTQAELNTWLAANPGRTATLTQVNNLIINSRLSTGALPLDFFSIPVPQGFATRTPQSFDITTLEGLKHFRLRQVYDANFGSLRAVPNSRYIQFGLRIFF